MRLSDLVAACNGTDPELAVEDEHGIPRPVTSADHAYISFGPVVLLEPARDDED
jgi:hypothetical protein